MSQLGVGPLRETASVMRIRRAVESDVTEIRRIHGAGISQVCSRDYPSEVIASWLAGRRDERYRTGIQELSFWILEDGAQIIGFGSANLVGGKVEALFLDPAFRGKGYAAILLAHLESTAIEAGAESLRLESSLSAKAFYEKHGYRVCAGDGSLRLASGVVVEGVPMLKSVQAQPTVQADSLASGGPVAEPRHWALQTSKGTHG